MMVVNHMTSLMFIRYAVTSESDTPCFCWRNDTKLPIRSNFLSMCKGADRSESHLHRPDTNKI